MVKQYPLKINTTFIETKPAGLAAKYLNSGEIHPRAGVEVAIACLFAPLGAALDGASRSQVEELVAASRTQIETYLALALSRCQENFALKLEKAPHLRTELPSNRTPLSTQADTEANPVDEIEIEENIDFESEEI